MDKCSCLQFQQHKKRDASVCCICIGITKQTYRHIIVYHLIYLLAILKEESRSLEKRKWALEKGFVFHTGALSRHEKKPNQLLV